MPLPSGARAAPGPTDGGLPLVDASRQLDAASTALAKPTRVAKFRSITSIAVDDDAVYVTDLDRTDFERHATNVYAIPHAGGPPRKLASNQRGAHSLTVAKGNLYWLTIEGLDIDHHAPPRVVMISTRDARKASVKTIPLHRSCAIWPNRCQLAADDRSLYVPGIESLLRVGLADGRVDALFDLPRMPQETAFAVDATHIYWFDSTQGIMAIGKTGGAASSIATPKVSNAIDMASDGKHVFLADGGRLHPNVVGSIIQVATSGGSVARHEASTFLADITLDADSVYWATYDELDGQIMKVDKASGATTLLANHQQYPAGVVARGQYLYWANSGDGTVWRIAR